MEKTVIKKRNGFWQNVKKFSQNKVRIKGRTLSTMTIVGLLGVILLYISTAGIVSVVAPWWVGRGDSPRHVDYVWRVYHGDIPKYEDGIRYPALAELGQGRYIGQPASANPPLFYIIHAPFEGELLDSGHWHEAIGVGRAINIFMGILCIFALAWGGWLLGGSRREIFAVAVPALAVLMNHFTALNLNFAVDALLVLFSTLGLVLSYKLLQYGLKPRYLISLGLVSILGMATKAPYIVILFVSLLAVVIAALKHGDKNRRRSLIRGIAVSSGIFVLVLIAIGWFYYFQNYQATGDWFSNFPKDYSGPRRPYKSLVDVLTGEGLWSLFYASYAAKAIVSVALASFAIAGVFIIYDRNRFIPLVKDKTNLIMTGLLVLALAGVFATQIQHAVGSGGYYFRYLLPAILPISLFMVYGLLEFKWLRGMLVLFFALSLAAWTIYLIPKSSSITYTLPSIQKVSGTINKIKYATEKNNIPTSASMGLLAIFPVGAVLLGASLYTLSGSTNTPRAANSSKSKT